MPHIVWSYIFMLYCYLAVEVAADMGTIWDLLYYKGLSGQILLKPFFVTEATSHILNVIMFMPLGFLLPLVWKNFREITRVIIVGFFMSFAIETCQLFCHRVTDVNDLITNTVGTIIGYCIWGIFHKIFPASEEKSRIISKFEPVCYIFLGVLGIFLLYNRRLL